MDVPVFPTGVFSGNFGDTDGIGFRLQFFCKKCKLILSPNKLVQGCPKCQEKTDLLLV